MIRAIRLLAVVSMACVLFPVMAHAQCTRCCGAQGFWTSLTITPASVEEGKPVSITIGVSSCYDTTEVFTATVKIIPTESECSSSTEEFSVSGTVFAREHRIFTHTFPAPKCDSTYDVTMESVSTMNFVPTVTLTVE